MSDVSTKNGGSVSLLEKYRALFHRKAQAAAEQVVQKRPEPTEVELGLLYLLFDKLNDLLEFIDIGQLVERYRESRERGRYPSAALAHAASKGLLIAATKMRSLKAATLLKEAELLSEAVGRAALAPLQGSSPAEALAKNPKAYASAASHAFFRSWETVMNTSYRSYRDYLGAPIDEDGLVSYVRSAVEQEQGTHYLPLLEVDETPTDLDGDAIDRLFRAMFEGLRQEEALELTAGAVAAYLANQNRNNIS